MSSTVISQGYIAVLFNPPGKEAFEEISERLCHLDSNLQINYEGTLLMSDDNCNKKYSEREFQGDLFIIGSLNDDSRNEFIEQANEAGFSIDANTIQPYTCIWYNGTDSPVFELTKENFLSGKI